MCELIFLVLQYCIGNEVVHFETYHNIHTTLIIGSNENLKRKMYYHVNQYECRAIFYQIIKLTDGKQKTTKQQQINKLQIKESLEKEKKSKFKLAEYLFNIKTVKLGN